MSDPILSDLSTPVLARAIRENLYAFFRFVGRSSLAEIDEGPGWLRWRTPIAHPWFNGVLCWRPPGEGDAGFVEHSLAFFRSRGAPEITWWCEPDLSPAAWGPYLQAHGFSFDDSTPGMALDLDQLPHRGGEAGELPLPAGCRWRRWMMQPDWRPGLMCLSKAIRSRQRGKGTSWR